MDVDFVLDSGCERSPHPCENQAGAQACAPPGGGKGDEGKALPDGRARSNFASLDGGVSMDVELGVGRPAPALPLYRETPAHGGAFARFDGHAESRGGGGGTP